MMRTLSISAAFLVVLAACGPAEVVEGCGTDTTLVNGVCVADPPGDKRCGEGTFLDPDSATCEPLVACGEGTVLVDGICTPEAECGEGTSLDLATNTCVPDIDCGPGTAPDAEGVCLPIRACGAGTTFNPETDECEADFPCADGSQINPDTGLCESNTMCGPGQLLIDGVCYEPNQSVAAAADFEESVPDQNDPLIGGEPEEVALSDDGETILVGTIARPADVLGNDTLVQDRDVWRFEATGGSYLSIEVLDLGLPSPVFILEGPAGYRRTSAIGYQAEADREVMLPRDGAYELTIVPSAFLTSGVPLGNPDAHYAVRITELDLPGAVNHTPGTDYLTPTLLEFNLKDLSDNFFGIDAAPGTPVQLTFEGLTEETWPSVLVFDSDYNLISDRQVIEEQDFAGVYVKEQGAIVVIDWMTSTGPADEVTVKMHEVGFVDRGDVFNDASASTGEQDLPGLVSGAYRINVSDRQVIIVEVVGTGLFNPDVQVTGPGGTRGLFDDDDDFFFLADAGEYIFFVYNDAATDDTGVRLILTMRTPADLGALAIGETESAEVIGSDLLDGFDGFERAFLVAEASVPSLLGFDIDIEAGDPDLSVYSIDGILLRRVHRPQLDRPLFMENRDPRPLLIELDADDQPLVGWTVTSSVAELPPFFDAEPNDTRPNAVILDGVPTRVRGYLGKDETDVYQIELLDPLDDDQSLLVHFDNMASDNAFGFISDGAYVRVRDENYIPVSSVPNPDSSPGTLGVNTATYVASYEGPGIYYIELFGDFITDESPYVLTVDVVDTPVENEPNNEVSNADDIGAVPTSIVGYRDEDDDFDTFTFTLTDDVPFGSSLSVLARNFENNNRLELTLTAEDGTILKETDRVLNTLQVPSPPAGTYVLTVGGPTGGEFVYHVDIDISGYVEAEPNDVPGLANDVGQLGVDAPITFITYADDEMSDVFSFGLDAPLAEDQSILVDGRNLDDGSDVILVLYGDESGELSAILNLDESSTAQLIDSIGSGSTGPFLLEVIGTTSKPDRTKVTISVGPLAESEPNQDQNSADIMGFPNTITGSVRPGDSDVIGVALTAGQDVFFQMDNRSDGSNITATFLGPDFGLIGEGTGFRVSQPFSVPVTGTYYVQLSQAGDPDTESDTYTVEVREND